MSSSALPTERICVIDDDDSVRESLKLLLETFGLIVQTYSSGDDFLADDWRRSAKCFIIDQHLPYLNGLDIVDRLIAEGSVVPAILITGRPDRRLHQRARESGVAVLEKPFGSDVLIERIRAAIAGAPDSPAAAPPPRSSSTHNSGFHC